MSQTTSSNDMAKAFELSPCEERILKAAMEFSTDVEVLEAFVYEVQDAIDDYRISLLQEAIKHHRKGLNAKKEQVLALEEKTQARCEALEKKAKERASAIEDKAKDLLEKIQGREKQIQDFCQLFDWLVSKGVSPDAAVRGAEYGVGRWNP